MGGLIVHDWIESTGGAERVLDAWVEMFPTADVFTLWNEAPNRYPNTTVRESWMAHSSLRRHKALAMPLMPRVWQGLDLRPYDWVLASSYAFSHHVGVAASRAGIQAHVYAHTPARYLWAPEFDPRGRGALARLGGGALRAMDRKGTGPSTNYAVNSEFIKQRASAAWGVDAEVIYPPVNTAALGTRLPLSESERATIDGLSEPYLLAASRFVPQKLLDVAMNFADAVSMPIVVCGRGPEEARLRAHATTLRVPTTFVISPSDALLHELMRQAEAYVFPPVEDFGIMPVEAAALGCPTVVNVDGGAPEALRVTAAGATFDFSDLQSSTCRAALDRAVGIDRDLAIARAATFDVEVFKHAITRWMELPGK